MIRIRDLQFGYPATPFRLQIPSWEVPDAARVAIVGPSGSGKTTLLHLLAGILVPQQGQIEMGAFNVTRMNDASRRDFRASQIGLVFQRFELIDYLNVASNILLPYTINRALQIDASVRKRMQELAHRAGISHLLRRPVQRLSQGEQQRVAICRALITQPQWLLADEPTGNLDPQNKRLIVDLLHQQAEVSQATLIMVTHDVSLMADFSLTVDFQSWCAAPRDASRQEAIP
ncbi:MAG: ATP-binding cassette domain-containing protein [Pirellulaceae bacterium]|nr:ATP-binding cassette domain-containing protein [Pirellulaceae bacterium]